MFRPIDITFSTSRNKPFTGTVRSSVSTQGSLDVDTCKALHHKLQEGYDNSYKVAIAKSKSLSHLVTSYKIPFISASIFGIHIHRIMKPIKNSFPFSSTK